MKMRTWMAMGVGGTVGYLAGTGALDGLKADGVQALRRRRTNTDADAGGGESTTVVVAVPVVVDGPVEHADPGHEVTAHNAAAQD
jgi:hypothetical protein